MKIKAHVRIENARLGCAANVRRLIVRGDQDISKSMLGLGITPDYRETYLVMKEAKGFIWREVTHGCGINGHFPTVRALVRATATRGYVIDVLAADVPAAWFDCVRARVAAFESPRRPLPPLPALPSEPISAA